MFLSSAPSPALKKKGRSRWTATGSVSRRLQRRRLFVVLVLGQTLQRISVHRDLQRRLVVVRETLDRDLRERQRDALLADARDTAYLQHRTDAVRAGRRDHQVVDLANLVAVAANNLGSNEIGDALLARRR